MLSIFLHLALTAAILWYQQKMRFEPSSLYLTVLWYLVSVASSLIETTVQTATWLSGMFLQSLILAIFYLPPVFFSLRLAKRKRLPVWKSMAFFLCASIISTVVASMAFVYVPFIQHLNR